MTDEDFEEFRAILISAFFVCVVDVGMTFFSVLREYNVEQERKLTERQQMEIESQLWSV